MKLKDFLLSDETMVVTNEKFEKYTDAYAKMTDKNNDIIYIYRNRYNRNSIFNPLDEGYAKIYGMYSIANNTFYFLNSFERKYCNLDLSDLNISNLPDLVEEIENKVNAMILEKIENDETRLNVNLDDIKLVSDEHIKDVAETKIASSFENEVNVNSYANFKLSDMEYALPVYIAYMNDETLTILEEYHNFIEKNKGAIYREINYNKRLISCIKDLKENPEYDLMLKLNHIFHNSSYKTLNITYKKDGNEMTFKIENNFYLHNPNSTIGNYKITPKKDKDLFRKTFKDENGFSSDIEPEYIEKITYGKTVLYEKNA